MGIENANYFRANRLLEQQLVVIMVIIANVMEEKWITRGDFIAKLIRKRKEERKNRFTLAAFPFFYFYNFYRP